MSGESRVISMRSVVVLLGLLLAVTGVVAGAVVGVALGLDLSTEQGLTVLAWAVLAHGTLMFLTIRLWVRRCGLRWRALGLVRPTQRIWHLLWQIPAVLIAIVVTNAVFLTLVGRTDQVEGTKFVEELAQDVSTLAAIAILCGVVMAAPLWEEAVFRGVLFSALRERMALVWVCLITAGLFAVAHAVPVMIPYFLVMGIALALLRAFHHNLWAPIIMHATVNLLASVTVLSVILAA